MTTLTDKRASASLHILELILDCKKHEAETISSLSHAFNVLHHPGFDNISDFGDDVPVCADSPIPYEPVALDHANVRIAFTDSTPPVEATLTPAPATAVATVPAKKAPARKAAAKKEPAPLPTPEPAANLPGTLEEPEAPAATDTGEALSPKEAERFRALIRDTYVAKTKLIATQGDPDNVRRQDFTSKFTAVVESFGAKTVSLAAPNDLPAILDAVRSIAA
jgi:hypothetical protein